MVREKRYRLKRELSLFNVTIMGVGIILGAGIYALIGVAAGETGNTIWLSFLIAAIVAGFSGFSYAELSSMFSGDGGEYDYTGSAFGSKVAFFVSIVIILTGIVSAATVSLGFAGYLSSLVSFNYLFSAVLLVVLMSLISFYGIKESNKFNLLATTVEFIGLVIIIIIGFKYIGSVDLFDMPNGYYGVLKSGALLFFAFMGFETIVKLREETKNPNKTIPKAILLSVVITSVVYVLVSIAAVSILPAVEISGSNSPLADVAAVSFGGVAFVVLGIIALFSTSNTVLLTMLTTSRLTYDMGKGGSLPRIFGKVHAGRRTPHVSILIIGLATILLAFIGNIELIANITASFLFLTFAVVNLSAIVLRYKMPRKRSFKMPFNIGRFPVLAALGVITSLIMLVFSFFNIFLG